MVTLSDQLVWELVKKHNCFHRKVNGSTKRSGKETFSVEPGNLTSLNRLQVSGLANTKSFDVTNDEENRTKLLKKSTKTGKFRETAINKNFHKSSGALLKQTSDVFYRRDLKKLALGKYTKVYQSNRRAKGNAKLVPVKKGRGSLSE